MNVLVIEDDERIGTVVQDFLKMHELEVTLCSTGKSAREAFRAQSFSACLLDIGLPDADGVALCQEFHQLRPQMPVIMLTALSELDNKLAAFRAGADDYITKPFHLEELYARLMVCMKRTEATDSEEITIIGQLEIRHGEKKVFREGREIALTAKEYRLLEVLARAHGKPVAKDVILEKVWDLHFDPGTNAIEVYISFLRNKIDKPFITKMIHTKPGFGYYLKDEN